MHVGAAIGPPAPEGGNGRTMAMEKTLARINAKSLRAQALGFAPKAKIRML
jgi:hypothetical protein